MPLTQPTLTRRRALAAGAGGAVCGPWAAARAAGPAVLRIPGGRDPNDRRYGFTDQLLTEALAAAGHPVKLQRLLGLSQRRIALDLASGLLDVAVLPTVGSSPPEVLPVRWPIRRGLLGLRLLLARPERAQALAQVRSVAELQRFTLGYGGDWRDIDQMRDLGFRIETSGSYTGLFQMLRAGRFDYLHRGVNEVWDELANPELAGTGMVVVPKLALYFPLDDFFHVGAHSSAWALRIEHGLQTLRASGRYAALFRQTYGEALRRAELPKRRVLHLSGYGVEPGTPIDEFDVLQLLGTSGDLRLPR
jgi:hypothetical protein